jgi:long-chain acyl-CoA synthetase
MKQHLPLLIEKFCQYEATQPSDLFLSEPVQGIYHEFTWQAAGREIRSMAAALRKMGLGKGDKVGILSKNCAHWVMSDLAISLAGCICVPLYPNITPEAIREIIEHSESKAIFIGKLDNPTYLRQGVPDELIQITYPFYPNEGCLNWDELVATNTPLEGAPDIDPDALACIVYTSGTTGQPKGVMHNHAATAYAVDAFLKSYPHLKKETFFSYLPLCHVAERMLVECGAIFTGSSIYFVESMDTFAANLAHTQPTIFLAVPRIWEKLQEGILKKLPQQKLNRLLSIPGVASLIRYSIKKKLGLSRYKHAFTGASPINPALLFWFQKLGIIIQEAYGMTENLALSHSNRKHAVKFGTVGTSYEGVTVRLGQDNEVQVKSEASMLGYYKEPELTEASFEDGFLKTGDEGSIDAEGYLTITGRIKDQFKTSKGKYVMPAVIESKLLQAGMLSQVCVIGSGLPNAMAICTLSETIKSSPAAEQTSALQELLEQTNCQLEHHERLSKVIVVGEEWTIANGLLTPTLKIKRKAVDASFGEHYLPWSQEEKQVIWAQ